MVRPVREEDRQAGNHDVLALQFGQEDLAGIVDIVLGRDVGARGKGRRHASFFRRSCEEGFSSGFGWDTRQRFESWYAWFRLIVEV